MRWLPRRDRRTRRAATAVALASVLILVVLAGALHVEPPPASDASAPAWNPLPPEADTSESTGDASIRAAVGADPFREDRSPPERRYVLPRHRTDDPGPGRTARRVGVRLVGTATFTDRPGLAALRLEARRSRVVTSGTRVGGLNVTRIEAGRIVLSGPDTTLVLRVASPEAR